MKNKICFAAIFFGWIAFSLLALSNPVFCDDDHCNSFKPMNKIDIQAHFHSPDIFNAITTITGQQAGPGWYLLSLQTETYMQTLTIEERLALLDQFGIEKAVFSFPSVYLFMRDEQNQVAERQEISEFINDYFAQLHQSYPTRAFFMANVALTVATTEADVNWSIMELRRAIEELGLQAVCIPTNIAGMPISDPLFEPFFDEVERLGVPLYIHPESPYCIEKMTQNFLFAIVGFPADEALMVANLILPASPGSLNFLDRHPDLKIIITHLGGSIPYFYSRLRLSPAAAWLPKPPEEYLKHFYYDTAIGNPEALRFLIKFLGSANQIIFGTDHPYVPAAEASTIAYIQETGLSKKRLKKIYFKNAEELFGIGD